MIAYLEYLPFIVNAIVLILCVRAACLKFETPCSGYRRRFFILASCALLHFAVIDAVWLMSDIESKVDASINLSWHVQDILIRVILGIEAWTSISRVHSSTCVARAKLYKAQQGQK